MTTRPFAFTCILLGALLAAGCGKVHHANYYTLALTPTLSPATNGEHTLGPLAVREFNVPAYLRQGRIVYRESPTEIGFYQYHRWVTNPGSMVTIAIIGTVRSSGRFSNVESDASHMKPDFLLTGQVERLDEIDYSGGVRVEVKLSAQLDNVRSKCTVWSGAEAVTTRVEKKPTEKKTTMNSVVMEMSRAVQKCVDSLLADMQRRLDNAPQCSSHLEPMP
jgi:ABC-type uncharacterized transport system auxiliary subunit